MASRFDSKVIVVTGGSSGIGLAVARRIAAEGGAVVIGARRAETGEEAAASIRADGGTAQFIATDVTSGGDVAALVRGATARFGRLDGAFNNVGGVDVTDDVRNVGDEGWRAELDLNLTSVFFCLREEIAALHPDSGGGGGSIVNNASIAGAIGIPGLAPYVAAKHGVIGLTKSAALEVAAHGIRVNALVTGNVDTPLYRRLVDAPLVGEVDLPAPNPAGRVAAPEEVAAFVAFLLSDEARFITGAALPIDGASTSG